MRILLLASLLSIASGCANLPDVHTLTCDQIRQMTAVSHDDFRKSTTVSASRLKFGQVQESDFGLSASKIDAQPNIIYSLILTTSRSPDQGWAFWKQAFDEHGHELTNPSTSSEVGQHASVYESIAFALTREWLVSNSRTGIKVRVDGSRDQIILELPPNYIQGFLLKADDVLGR